MKVLRVYAHGTVNSFRNYARTTIHDTLPLPPKTTLIGLLGAALGYEFNDSRLLELYNIKVGVIGTSKSDVYDLMRVFKVKGADSDWSLLQRQLNWENEYRLYYEAEDRNEEFAEALRCPVFAPTLGLADELVNIKEVKVIEVEEVKKGNKATFTNTLLPFHLDPLTTDVSWPDGDNDIIVPLTPYRLPIKFELDKKGSRRPIADVDYIFTHNLHITTVVPNEYTACRDGDCYFVLH